MQVILERLEQFERILIFNSSSSFIYTYIISSGIASSQIHRVIVLYVFKFQIFKFFSEISFFALERKKKRERKRKTRPFANSRIPFHPRREKDRNPLISPSNRAPSKPQLSFLILTDAPSRFHYIILFNIHPRNPSQNYLRVPKSPNFRSRVPFQTSARHPPFSSPPPPLPQDLFFPLPELDSRFATTRLTPRLDRYVCGRFAPVDKFDKTRNRSFLTGANRYSDRFIRRIRLVSPCGQSAIERNRGIGFSITSALTEISPIAPRPSFFDVVAHVFQPIFHMETRLHSRGKVSWIRSRLIAGHG